jgi:hypothetical protein
MNTDTIASSGAPQSLQARIQFSGDLSSMYRTSAVLVAAAGTLVSALPALAQVQLKATLDKGQELKYTLVIDQHFVTTFNPPDKPPTERISHFELGTNLKVLEVTPAGARVELRFDDIKGTITPAGGDPYSYDTSAAPKPGAPKDATTFYETSKKLIATPQTFLVKPDGTIDEFKPTDELVKAGGARLLRRVLEADGVQQTFGPVFALKFDGQPAKLNDQWTFKPILLADRGRQPVDELRTLTKVDGAAATVTSIVRSVGATGSPVNAGSIYLRDATANGTHIWDAAGSRLVNSKYEDSITFIMMLPNDAKNEMTTITTTTISPRTGSGPGTPAPASSAPTPAPAPKK